jgi:hypothetical protein
MRQAHWKQSHEGVSGCMDESGTQAQQLCSVTLRLITNPLDVTKKQRRMLAQSQKQTEREFVTMKGMHCIIGAKWSSPTAATMGDHHEHRCCMLSDSIGTHASSVHTPTIGLKIIDQQEHQNCSSKKNGKMEKWKNLFGRISPNQFFHFSIFPFFRDSGTDS